MSENIDKKHRFNKLFIIVVGAFLLFSIILTYFIWDEASGETIKAKNENHSVTNIQGSTSEKKPEIHNQQLTSETNRKKEKKVESAKNSQPISKKKQLTQKVSSGDNHQVQQEEQKGKSEDMKSKDNELSKTNNASANQQKANKQVPLKTGKVVYLTFDDGPHPTASEGILSLLKKYNAKATFFMLEPNMRNNSEVVKQMVKDGHTVGVHGVTHDVSKIYKSPASFVDEMNRAIGYIDKTVHVQTRLIRAPYGSKPYITPPFKKAADKEQFIMWDWTVDSYDWRYPNGQYVQKVIDQTNALVGKEPLVVLLHERPTTLNYLEKLLKFYQDNGYEMDSINESDKPIQFQ